MNISAAVSPFISINANITGGACSGANGVFTAQIVNGGTAPVCQWKKNGQNVGTNSTTYTTSVNNGDQITCTLQSNLPCASPSSVNSSVYTVALTGSSTTYYQDQDGDGYGSSGNTVTSCSPVAGYVTIGGDCDDSNADINPGTDEWENGIDDNCNGLIDEVPSAGIYYRDQDNDGYGNANNSINMFYMPPGYVSNALDCNDNLATVYPGAPEICGNGIDEDCDGQIDENCGPMNDQRSTALMLPVQSSGDCQQVSGTLLNATPSSEANSTCITGGDVWYYFVAPTPGISIKLTNTTNNVLLELQNNSGQTIKTENYVAGVGGENLNYTGLTTGQTYWLVVRNYNGQASSGSSFNLCGSALRPSYVLPNTIGNASFCTGVGASEVGANKYVYQFKNLSTGANYSKMENDAMVYLEQVDGLRYGQLYDVKVDAYYSCVHGDGSPDPQVVPGTQGFNIGITTHQLLRLNTPFECPNNVALNSWISTLGFDCAAVDYQWEFRRVTPSTSMPITVNRGEASTYLYLGNVPGLQVGVQYYVRIRPVFAGGMYGSYGVQSCMKITSVAGMALQQNDDQFLGNSLNDRMEINIFPNPLNEGPLNIEISGTDDETIEIRLLNSIGQLVHQENRFNAVGIVQISPEEKLAPGLYHVTVKTANEQITKTLVVQ
jgi:hypothetical protein